MINDHNDYYELAYDEGDYYDATDDEDVEWPEPNSIDDPWWFSARSDW